MILVGYMNSDGEIVITGEYEGHPEANARMDELETTMSGIKQVVKCRQRKDGRIEIKGFREL